MANTTTLLEALTECINDMREGEQVALHNEYCDAVNYCDDRIYYMDEFDDLHSGSSPLEIARLVQGEDFNTNDDYYRYTIYGVESFNYPDEYIDIDEIAEYIAENADSLYNDDIQEIINEYEEGRNNG